MRGMFYLCGRIINGERQWKDFLPSMTLKTLNIYIKNHETDNEEENALRIDNADV
jgi:hypothetical protein